MPRPVPYGAGPRPSRPAMAGGGPTVELGHYPSPLIPSPFRRLRHWCSLDPCRWGHLVTHFLIPGISAPFTLRGLDTPRPLPRRFAAQDQSHPHCRRQGENRNELRSRQEMMKDETAVLIASQEFDEKSGHRIKSKIKHENLAIAGLPRISPHKYGKDRERGQ